MSKPPLFHVGQAVVCIGAPHEWEQAPGCMDPLPKKGIIYIVEGIDWDEDGWYLSFAEFPHDYLREDGFAPVELLPDEALAELLSETLEPVTA